MVSQAELISKGYHSWFLVLSQFFIEGLGPFNNIIAGVYVTIKIIHVFANKNTF